MKPKTLGILAAVVLVLSAFVYFFERKLPSSEERRKLDKRVFSIESGDVRKVSIERGENKFALDRVDLSPLKSQAKSDSKSDSEDELEDGEDVPPSAAQGEWRLTAPLAARADAGLVGQLVDALVGLEHSEAIDDPNLAETGLDHPQAKIRLTTAKGEKVLEVGGKLPLGSNVLVRFEGESTAYSVSDALLAQLDREAGDWRDKRLFPGERDDVREIALFGADAANGASARLVRRDGKFVIEAGSGASKLADRADHERVEALLSDLSGLTADRFVDPPTALPEMGFDPPFGRLEVGLSNRKQPVRIEIGGLVGGVAEGEMPARYVRVEGQIGTAREHLSEAIARGAAEWRSRAIVGLDVYQVERAQISDEQGKLDVERDGADWRRGKDYIPFTPVSDLLYLLTTLEAEKIASMAEAKSLGANLAKPAITFDLRGEKDEKEKVEIFAAGAAGVPVRTEGRDVILWVPEAKIADLRAKLVALRAEKAIPKSESSSESSPDR